MSEIVTPQGELRVIGMAHGAINTMIVIFDAPADDWEMKQFPSRHLLEQFAMQHQLLIVEGQKDE